VASAPPPNPLSACFLNLRALPRTNYLMRNERLGASINSGDSTYRIQAFYDDCEGTGRRYASLEHKVLVSVKTPLGRSRTDAGQFPKSLKIYIIHQRFELRMGKKYMVVWARKKSFLPRRFVVIFHLPPSFCSPSKDG
jgi:hypothetical protein